MQLSKYFALSLASIGLVAAVGSRELLDVVKGVRVATEQLASAVKTLSPQEIATTRKLDPVALELVWELGNATVDFNNSDPLNEKLSKKLLKSLQATAKSVSGASTRLVKEAPQIKTETTAGAVAQIAADLQAIGNDYAALGRAFEAKASRKVQKKAGKAFRAISSGFGKIAKAFSTQ